MTDHMKYLEDVAAEDVAHLKEKERTYGGSWKKRGGVGAFMMLARKWDRLENLLQNPLGKTETSLSGRNMTTFGAPYDIFQEIQLNPDGKDGSALAEIRDLRRYLLLVEAEMVARGVVKDYAIKDFVDKVKDLDPNPPRVQVPVHAVGDPEPMLTGNPEAHDYEGSVRTKPVPIEDSNRHADRAPAKRVYSPSGRVLKNRINNYERDQLTLEEMEYYEWDDDRFEWKLK
jgi:hypothetical protein